METIQILTDEGKEYLRMVIKPFRDRIKVICKTATAIFFFGRETLYLVLKTNDYLGLPELPLNEMSKGMEPYKEYTLEKLGL